MLDFESSGDYARAIEPQHVDQPNRLSSRTLRQCHRELVETAIAETSVTERSAAVVGRHVHRKTKRAAQIAEPRLNLGVRPIGIQIDWSTGRLVAHAREIGFP